MLPHLPITNKGVVTIATHNCVVYDSKGAKKIFSPLFNPLKFSSYAIFFIKTHSNEKKFFIRRLKVLFDIYHLLCSTFKDFYTN